jgi:hypothetical protein
VNISAKFPDINLEHIHARVEHSNFLNRKLKFWVKYLNSSSTHLLEEKKNPTAKLREIKPWNKNFFNMATRIIL